MKRVALTFILINILGCTSKKDTNIFPINGKELLAVADGGSLKDFNELIEKSKFHITDSSLGKVSGIEFIGYSTEDSSMPPNILDVQINKDSNVIYLSFRTESKENFLQIKEDIIATGFKIKKSSYDIEQFEKENNPIDILMMNFEKASKSFQISLGKKNP